MAKTKWKTWSETKGDGFMVNYTAFYKQLWDVEKDEPIGEPIRIDYAEYERL